MNMQILDNEEQIRSIDKSNMLGTISDFSAMVRRALSFKLEGALAPAIQNVVIAGMGGSAVSGDILLGLYAQQLKLPVEVKRGYALPAHVGEKSLVVVISYSGNTEEALQVLKSAEKQSPEAIRKGGKAKIAVITSGGKLAEIAEKKKYPKIMIPADLQPRAALGYLFFALQTIFESTGLISVTAKAKEETVKILNRLTEEYAPSVPTIKNKAKQLAQKLFRKIPLILGAEGITWAAAYRWKTQFNENSSGMAFCSLLPEMNHNEIVGLNNLVRTNNDFVLIVLRDDKDNERIKKRIEITKSILAPKLAGIVQIEAEGVSSLAKMFSLILMGDFVSTYLAVLTGVDPAEIDIITRLKKELMR